MPSSRHLRLFGLVPNSVSCRPCATNGRGDYTATAPLFPWVASFPNFDAGVWGSALISAEIGAGVGAWMAGRIARIAKLRDELLAEFRCIDVAITLCISISNVDGGMKKH